VTIRDYFNQNIQIKIGDIITFTNEDIVSNSITFNGTMINNLQAGSSRLSFYVKPSDKTDTLLKYKDKLSAEVLVGQPNNEGTIIYTPIFRGYLSNKITTDVKRYGFDTMSLTIEDPTTGLLKTEVFPNSLVTHYVEGTLSNIIDTYYKGIVINKSNAVKQDARVVGRVVKVGETLESLLKDLCYELGYSYYWSGVALEFYRFDDQKTSAITDIIDYSKLAANKTTAININKDIRKYSSVRVEGDIYEEVSNVLIYRDISGSSDNVNANITVKAGQYYPPQSSTENPTIVKCEKDLDTGKEIINIEEITPNIVASSSSLKSTIAIASNNTLSVCLYNPTSSDITVTRLECSAKVKRLASTDIIKVADNNDKAETYEKKVTCIHNTSYLEDLADDLIQYYKYADNAYIFFVEDDNNSVTNTKAKYPYPLFLSKGLVGKAVTIKDDVVSGLKVDVVVTSVIIDTSSNLIKYQGVGFSNLEFDKSIIKTNVTIPDDPTQGPKGDKGDTGPQGPKGDKGDPGEPADERTFYLTSKEVVIDRRTNGYRTNLSIYTSKYSEAEVAQFTAMITVTYNDDTTISQEIENPTIVKLSSTEYRIDYNIISGLRRSKYPKAIKYTATDSKGSSKYIDVGVIDNTVYNKYVGMRDALPTISDATRYYDGDTVFNKSTSVLYVLQEGVWVSINSSSLTEEQKSTMLGYAQKDILSTIPVDSVAASDYAYFNTIITNTIIASQLTMTDLGIIQSQGVDSSSVGSDGFLTVDGYRFEGRGANGKGVLRAKKAYINDFSGKNATLTDASITGELSGKYINTVAPSSATATLSISNSSSVYNNGEVRHWLTLKLGGSSNINSGATSTTTNVQGSVYGFDISGYTIQAQSAQWGDPYGVQGYDYPKGTAKMWYLMYYPYSRDGSFINYAGQTERKTLYPDEAEVSTADSSKRIIVKDSSGNIIIDTNTTELQYVNVTASMTNQFKAIGTNNTVNASGTVRGAGKTLSGTMSVLRGVDSTTFSQNGNSIIIPDSGKLYGGDLYVSVSYSTPREGVELSNIYAKTGNTSIGEASRYFKNGYINTLSSDVINANTVWGAVAN